jgi:Bifunctional DNA primase/polymerase, N-terminal/Primase C terminal 1 (PriCT-1)
MSAITNGGAPAGALPDLHDGAPLFPCGADKRPLTPRGFYDASADPEQLAVWTTRWRGCRWGMPTGATTGVDVLDVDGAAGADTLHKLERVHGPLPRTYSVTTPSGGQHYYFDHVDGVRCSVRSLGPGLDVRSDGGYVIVPPSSGYIVDDERPIAPWPPWLLDLLRDDPAAARAAAPPEEWVALLRAIPHGQRNVSLARVTGHLLRRNVDVDVVAELAHAVNAARCRPPLPTRDVDRIIDSIARAELRRRAAHGWR